MLQAVLVLAAALFSVGLFGALTQQTVVMIMMGLELMINGVLLAAAAFWRTSTPDLPDGQVLVLVAFVVMAVEMAMGFALTTALFRTTEIDMTDMVDELSG